MTTTTNSTTPARYNYNLLSGPEQALLAGIARREFFLKSIDDAGDNSDFFEAARWSVRSALATAYAAGLNDRREAARRKADTDVERDESELLNTLCKYFSPDAMEGLNDAINAYLINTWLDDTNRGVFHQLCWLAEVLGGWRQAVRAEGLDAEYMRRSVGESPRQPTGGGFVDTTNNRSKP